MDVSDVSLPNPTTSVNSIHLGSVTGEIIYHPTGFHLLHLPVHIDTPFANVMKLELATVFWPGNSNETTEFTFLDE